MNRCAIVTVVLLLVGPALGQNYLTGTVKSSDGKPLAGVSVYARYGSTTTDSQGTFRIKRTEPVFFFSRSGYEPLAVVPVKDQNELSVTMEQSAGKTWVVPNCKDRPPESTGRQLRFAIPKEARVELVTDVDYRKRLVRYPRGKKKEWLALWDGATVSFGHPSPEDFLDATVFWERSITFENASEIGAIGTEDARGVTKSGGLWRWAGELGEFAKYWDVSPEAAAYFDKIIDGMCNEGFRAAPK